MKALEYAHVRRRQNRLSQKATSETPSCGGPSEEDIQCELEQVAIKTKCAHLPDTDNSSVYYSAFDFSLSESK